MACGCEEDLIYSKVGKRILKILQIYNDPDRIYAASGFTKYRVQRLLKLMTKANLVKPVSNTYVVTEKGISFLNS